jgi:hypothetical protein
MSEVDKIRRQIRELRQENVDGQHFITSGPLDACLSQEVVLCTLPHCAVEKWRESEIADIIEKGAKKVLATLLLLKEEKQFVRFIENEMLPNRPLDSQLPFAKETLKGIIPDTADEFFEKQWELVPTFFSQRLSHRYLPKNAILPFMKCEPLGSGAFGETEAVTIAAGNHEFEGMESSQVRGLRPVVLPCRQHLFLITGSGCLRGPKKA